MLPDLIIPFVVMWTTCTVHKFTFKYIDKTDWIIPKIFVFNSKMNYDLRTAQSTDEGIKSSVFQKAGVVHCRVIYKIQYIILTLMKQKSI